MKNRQFPLRNAGWLGVAIMHREPRRYGEEDEKAEAHAAAAARNDIGNLGAFIDREHRSDAGDCGAEAPWSLHWKVDQAALVT